MTGLLGIPYGTTQASYDLARLRRNGLITRRPDSSTCDLATHGLTFAIFYTKVHDRPSRRYSPPGRSQSPQTPGRPQLNRTPLRRTPSGGQDARRSLRSSAQLSSH
jgi:hypothetical protein